jgi:hypothetical protein
MIALHVSKHVRFRWWTDDGLNAQSQLNTQCQFHECPRNIALHSLNDTQCSPFKSSEQEYERSSAALCFAVAYCSETVGQASFRVGRFVMSGTPTARYRRRTRWRHDVSTPLNILAVKNDTALLTSAVKLITVNEEVNKECDKGEQSARTYNCFLSNTVVYRAEVPLLWHSDGKWRDRALQQVFTADRDRI